MGKTERSFLPFLGATDFRADGHGHFERRGLVHGRVTQSQRPRANLTAMALRPSWYCTATTVASAELAGVSRCKRTRSSNSKGKVDRKMACSSPPNSNTVASAKLGAAAQRGGLHGNAHGDNSGEKSRELLGAIGGALRQCYLARPFHMSSRKCLEKGLSLWG